MGGVDRHNQHRLQRFSLQMTAKFRKYYKSLFLGLIDMTLVNCYLVYIANPKNANVKKLDFYNKLLTHLLDPSHHPMYNSPFSLEPTRTPRPISSHQYAICEDRKGQGKKRVVRVCKVCSILAHLETHSGKANTHKRPHETFYYCEDCSLGISTDLDRMVFLHSVKLRYLFCVI